MRPPWLQVDMEFVEAKASDLGARLGISRREAVGLAVDLWSWVLKRSPDDAPPDGVVRDSRTGTGAVTLLERAAEWTGPEGRLATALEEVGLLERLPDGVRFRGTERYVAAWKKNRGGEPSAEPKRNRSGTGAEPALNRSGTAPEPAPKMKMKRESKEDPPNPPPGGGGSETPVGEFADEVASVMRERDPTWRWDAAKEQQSRPLLTKPGGTAEVVRRLRIALDTPFPRFLGLQSLVKHWDTYATAPPGNGAAQRASDGIRAGAGSSCTGCGYEGQGGSVGEPEVFLGYGCGCLGAWQRAQEAGRLHFSKAEAWASQRREEASRGH